jgi:D-amino-acid oxidase
VIGPCLIKTGPPQTRLADHSSGDGHVLVLGAGVSGLTTAFCLSRKGFAVTVLADRFAPNVTSIVAGALWEWPPAVCGHPSDEASLARARVWCETSYAILTELAADPATGVFVRPATFYFRQPIEEDVEVFTRMNEVRGMVAGFRHDPALIRENRVNSAIGLRDAYTYLAPMVDTDVYMRWLVGEVVGLGCRVVERKLSGPLRDQEAALMSEFDAQAIVNCTGLGAAELAEDEVRPLRGALVRVRNDGRVSPRIEQAHCMSLTVGGREDGFVFILPRGDDMLVLGGIAEMDERSLDIDLGNHEPLRAMIRRCVEFMPALRDAEIDAVEPVRVGLRPFRPRSVRLERESDTHIIHNYGHGGAGVTFSWGTSLEAAELAATVLRPSLKRVAH